MAHEDEEKRKYVFYHLRTAARVLIAAIPFVFFCFMLNRFYWSVMVASTKADFWWRNQATDCANSPANTIVPKEFWFMALYLICLTVLVIVSLVYLQRSMSRD